MDNSPQSPLFTSNSSEWYTPSHIAQVVQQALSVIDLDPCAPLLSADKQQPIKAARYFTQAENGLIQTWHGSVFLNPPYGHSIKHWIAKFVQELALGHIGPSIMLVPARTDTVWFQDVWQAQAICFIRGRLKFTGPNNVGNTATFPSVLAYFEPQNKSFANMNFTKAATHLGQIIYPYPTI